jgi:hypothetical protein
MQCIAYTKEMEGIYIIMVRKPQGKRPFAITKNRWTIILKYILDKNSVTVWSGFSRLRLGSKSGFWEDSNQLSVSIKQGKSRDV